MLEAESELELAARLISFCTHVPKGACPLGISLTTIFLGFIVRLGVG